MKRIDYPTREELEAHHLRLDLSSLWAAGYSKRFARKYLVDRFVNIGTYMTEEAFNHILNEEYEKREEHRNWGREHGK